MDFNREFNIISQNNIECLQPYYTTILSHDITNDGKFLLATVKNKKLAIFPLEKYLKDIHRETNTPDNNENDFQPLPTSIKLAKPKPISFVPVDNSLCVCLLSNTDTQYKFCLGGQGSIKGYKISTENIQECDEEWTINLSNETFVNCAILMPNNAIAIGCGDNFVYLFDQETRQPLAKLSGHQDYIHDLKCTKDHSTIYSCSEDGSVRQWDIRCPDKPSMSIFPYMNNNIKRSQFGKWIGAIDVSSNNEWLICGGGPSLSVWHMRTEKCSHIIQTPGVTYATKFFENNTNVMAAGSENTVTLWKRSDPNNSYEISSSINTIYSISHHYYDDINYDLFSFSGDSYQLEICENAKFIDWKLIVA